jgi:hypothetical protein
MEARLAAKEVLVVMIRAGKLGGLHGIRARGAVICQCSAVTRQDAARAGRRATTAQSSTRTCATSTHVSAPAGTAAGAAASARVAPRAPCGGTR